mgnify:CR=1 FL=1
MRGEKIGRYFEFKAAYVTVPADLAACPSTFTRPRAANPVLIHQAKYRRGHHERARATEGFTGFNYVYEPSKSSELQYWCRKSRVRARLRPSRLPTPPS